MRAEFADLVAANRMHPFYDATEEELRALMGELHGAIVDLNGDVARFIQHVAEYLFDYVPPGTVSRDDSQ